MQNPNEQIEESQKTPIEQGEMTKSELKNTKKEPGFWSEVLRFFFIIVFIIIPFRIFVAQPFIVDGASMDKTFANGQYLIVDQISYRFEEPERGSVLIFKYPKNPSQFFIKRVIGLPGESVSIKDGVVTLKNTDHPEGFVLDEPYLGSHKPDTLEAKLGENEYFVMGDNRDVSSDSRYWGPVPADNIIGRPFLRLYPLNTLSVFPGDFSEE